MKGRKQKNYQEKTYRQKVGRNIRGYAEVQTSMWITENNHGRHNRQDMGC